MNRRTGARDERRDGTVLREIVGQRTEARPMSEPPPSTFEAVTRQMLIDLQEEMRALRGRIDGLFTVVVGAIVLDLLLRLAGWR